MFCSLTLHPAQLPLLLVTLQRLKTILLTFFPFLTAQMAIIVHVYLSFEKFVVLQFEFGGFGLMVDI